MTALAQVTPAHTDWLYHHFSAEGPDDEIAAFRAKACGSGTIPWALDLNRMEEDFFLRLASGPGRSLSLEGAHLLAAELRDAVATRHAVALARVGRSVACAFDLHALVPVPEPMLRLGPDEPRALAWLWVHWGTTQALRHVAEMRGSGFRVSFWAADWTPWRALEALRKAWGGLRIEMRPMYDPS